jgi:multidrug efflux pump subunit AcrA (membrane-fusion protein)
MKEARTIVPSAADAQEVVEKKSALLEKLSQLAKISARREDAKRNEELIAADQNALQAAYKEKAYREILADKTKEYIREQSAIIRERANRLFPSRTRVEITEFNKSGALVDCLKIFIDDYDATVTNNANKVLAGIDISNAFSAFCGVTMPLIIDNSESINYDEPTDRQKIEMFVVKGQSFRVDGE